MVQIQYKNHNIKLKINLESDLSFVHGNKFKLEQVILNLLTNAKDAVEERFKEADDQNYQKEIKICTRKENSNLVLELEDNGKGITPGNLDKIFDPFFTTKDPEKGTGLGLSIVYGIIEEMAGEITVRSDLDRYTKFEITIPEI